MAAALFNLSLSLPLCAAQGSELCEEELGEQRSTAPPPPAAAAAPRVTSAERKQRWEAGQMDYLGDDSFDNIERKLNTFLK